jgi:hypothetical protein
MRSKVGKKYLRPALKEIVASLALPAICNIIRVGVCAVLVFVVAALRAPVLLFAQRSPGYPTEKHRVISRGIDPPTHALCFI